MTEERAVLAGGCFWGVQDLVRRLDGVLSTRAGYTGGSVPNATYRNLIYFHEVDKGGHFAAWEQPELFSAELRAAFRSLRKSL